jgi:hypothetical protein
MRPTVGEVHGEPHRVGVPVLDLGRMHADVRGGERARSDIVQQQWLAAVDRRDSFAPGLRVHCLGRLTTQAEQDRARRAVPATGGRQRPVQVDMHTDNGRHAFAKSVAVGGELVCGVLSTMGSASSSQPKVNRPGMS